MAHIIWDSSYSVNVKEIDKQHKQLIKIYNDLFEAMTQGKGNTILSNIINDLVNYTVYHFETEEKYFDEFKYIGRARHKQEHKDFVNKISDFKTKFDNGQVGISLDIMNFLNKWIKNHIKVSDKKYSELFNKNGLK